MLNKKKLRKKLTDLLILRVRSTNTKVGLRKTMGLNIITKINIYQFKLVNGKVM